MIFEEKKQDGILEKNNMKKYILYAIINILIILNIQQCRKRVYIERDAQNTDLFLKDSIRYYKNKLGEEIAIKTALVGDRDKLAILLSEKHDENGQLKRLIGKLKADAAGNITTITKIDTVEIEYEVEVPCEFERLFEKDEKFYKIGGISNQIGITLTDIEIPNTLSFVHSNGQIRVQNSNPFLKTTGADTFFYKETRKKFNVSLFAGYGYSESFAPVIGIGIGYSLFQFGK